MNKENLSVYENPGAVFYLEDLAARGRLGTYDMEIAFPFYKDASSLLEIGPGYGRCIDFLLASGFKGQITGIEYSAFLTKNLQEKYQNHQQVTIDHGDILEFAPQQKFDVVIAMFSLFQEFNKEEKLVLAKKIYQILDKNGKFIIDIMNHELTPLGGQCVDVNKNILSTQFGGTILSEPGTVGDINKICDKIGFKRVVYTEYATPADRERIVYVLQKREFGLNE